jgi:glycosyl transferase family 25
MSQIPIFVINLDRSLKRRESISAFFSKYSLEGEFVQAIDCHDLTVEATDWLVDREAFRHKHGREISLGEVACCLSHIRAWRMISDRNLPMAIVLEDDAGFGQDFADFARSEISVPADCDIVSLFHVYTQLSDNYVPLYRHYQISRPVGCMMMTIGLLLTKSGVDKLLEGAYPLRSPADTITGCQDYCGCISYGVNPMMIDNLGNDFGTEIFGR